MMPLITANQTNYNITKNKVLELYEKFIQFSEDPEISNILSDSKNILDSLKGDINRIKEDKFNLMVAGEAKSGKSTFINAYLGFDILPMDVMQCTSSIIEIKYGEEFKLVATYADGSKETIQGEDEIRQYLKENAAIDSDYRDIPVPTINTGLLIKTEGKPTEREVKELIAGVQDANIHNLPRDAYEQKIRDYINSKREVWQQIAVKLTVFYPFESEALRGIEIIDSPGVNAAGKVGDTTKEYVNNADAIMFLKPLTGAALESADFKRFLEQSSREKSKHALFLVLTRAADETRDNINKLCEQAESLYPGVAKEQILPVDSKVQLYKAIFENMPVDDISNYINEGLENDTIDNFITSPWMKSRGNKVKFLENLEEMARFEHLSAVLNQFGRRAHYIRLGEVLEKINKLSAKLNNELKQKAELYDQKIQDPKKFEIEMAKLKIELEGLITKMHEGIDEVSAEYSGARGLLRQKTDKLTKKYEKKLKAVSGEKMDEIKDVFHEAVRDYRDFVEDIQGNVIDDCNSKLTTLSTDAEIPYTSLEVEFTDEEFEEIKLTADENAYVTKSFTTGTTFKKVEKRSVFSEDKYAKIIKRDILERFDEMVTDTKEQLINFTKKILQLYRKTLTEQAESYKERLEVIRKEKYNNEQLIVLMEEIGAKRNYLEKIDEQIDQRRQDVKRIVNN